MITGDCFLLTITFKLILRHFKERKNEELVVSVALKYKLFVNCIKQLAF